MTIVMLCCALPDWLALLTRLFSTQGPHRKDQT